MVIVSTTSLLLSVFAARRYASAALAVMRCMSVCLSVRPSRSWILSKRININDIMTLKSGLRVTGGYWKWRRLIDHIRLSIDGHYKYMYSSILYRFLCYLMLNTIVTLKARLRITQDHWKWHHAKACVRFPSIVGLNMALTCIISEIKRDIGRKLLFFSQPNCILRPLVGPR